MDRPCLPIPRLFPLVMAAFLGLMPDAHAGLTINATFTGGDAPSNMAGGGNLAAIFNTAISHWEAAFTDPRDNWVVNLNYQWGDLGNSQNGRFLIGDQGGDPHRIESGTIIFNNSGVVPFFADPTPYDNSEYTHYESTTMEAPGGLLNVGRVYTDPTGDAAGRVDLLTIAEHEIGHALGLASDNTASPYDLVIKPPLPFAGLEIHTRLGDHLSSGTALMGRLLQNGDERVLISGLDVLAEAQISQFATPNLDPYAVPGPGSMGLTTLGLIVAAAASRRRSRHPAVRTAVDVLDGWVSSCLTDRVRGSTRGRTTRARLRFADHARVARGRPWPADD